MTRSLSEIEYDLWEAKRLGAVEIETLFRDELRYWWRPFGREAPNTTVAQTYLKTLRNEAAKIHKNMLWPYGQGNET